jgi:hypothetical protein
MSDESIQWYPSKVDWWIALLLCVPPVAAVGACTAMLLDGHTTELPSALGGLLLVCGIYVGLVFPMRYGIDDMNLTVRYGLCRQRIALPDIWKVYPTHNPLSSPALSLHRLRVKFSHGKSVMISPADRDGFLDDLAQKTGLKRDGDRLLRD